MCVRGKYSEHKLKLTLTFNTGNLHFQVELFEILHLMNHSVNNGPVKRLTLMARKLAFYIVPHAGWNYGIVTPFSLLKIGT